MWGSDQAAIDTALEYSVGYCLSETVRVPKECPCRVSARPRRRGRARQNSEKEKDMTASRVDPGYEHERKFLVADTSIIANLQGERIVQAYLWKQGGYSARVRRTQVREGLGWTDAPAMLTLKGPWVGYRRLEREVEIPVEDVEAILSEATHVVTKTRFAPIISEGEAWIVDVFHGDSEGLILAEFEGQPVAVETRPKPWWASEEVSGDERYSNDFLAFHPWSKWPKES